MTPKEEMLDRMERDAAESGYHLCPDGELLDDLIDGLVQNEERYGHGACPCRIASGIEAYDADIVCPCEYRDVDVAEFGMCYCCLFVSAEVNEDPAKMGPIPERRPVEAQDAAMEALERKEAGAEPATPPAPGGKEELTVWRCKVCGYLAARPHAPPVCPICKAKADRFEPFVLGHP